MTRPIVCCPRCRHRAPVRRRSPVWWLALAGTAGFFVAMVLASSLIGPAITLALPFMAFVGFALGPLHALATEDPTCARCGRVLTVPATAREVSAARAESTAAPRATSLA